MNFHILDDISNKVKVLANSDKTYYSVKDDALYLAKRDDSCRELSQVERKILISFFNQVYYQNTHNACEDCREKRLHEIDIEFSMYLENIKKNS